MNNGVCNPPEISHLNIQLRNGSVDVLSDCALSVDGKRSVPGPLDKLTPDDYVRLSWVAFQLDFYVPPFLGLFDKGIQILSPKNLNGKYCRRENLGVFEPTYVGGKIKSKADSASDATLPRSIRTNDHVQVRPRTEFYKVIGDKVLELNAHNGPGDGSLTAIRYNSVSPDIPLTRLCLGLRLQDARIHQPHHLPDANHPLCWHELAFYSLVTPPPPHHLGYFPAQ